LSYSVRRIKNVGQRYRRACPAVVQKQFRIGDIIADYDNKRELLRNYSEVSNSIRAFKNSKIIQFVGVMFAFISGFSLLVQLSVIFFIDKQNLFWKNDYIIPLAVFVIISIIFFLPKSIMGKLREAFDKLKMFVKIHFKKKHLNKFRGV
jgi:hypothetical protein